MVLRQGDGSGGYQRNPFVGGAKQHVELDPGGDDGFGIEFAQSGQLCAAVEQAAVEALGTRTPGLEREFPKTEHLAFDGEFEKSALIGLHVNR